MKKFDIKQQPIFGGEKAKNLGLIKSGIQSHTISVRLSEKELDVLETLKNEAFLGWGTKLTFGNVVKQLIKNFVKASQK